MDPRLQKQLFDEISGYMSDNSTRLAEREMSHVASRYGDPAYLERERKLLRSLPQIVGHSGSLPKAGDFLANDDTGVPIILTRQADGSLKALLNVCRHRGARVCDAAAGNQKIFTCRYHGWAYRGDGRLVAAPPPGFPNTDPADNGLIEFPVQERHGLIWVVLMAGASIDVAAHLGPLDAELASYHLGDYLPARDTVLRGEINWKFVLDGFLEIYHFPTLHVKTIAPWIHGKYSPFDSFGQNSRLVAVRKSIQEMREVFDEASFLKHVAVNYQIFPNTIIVWQGDHFEVWTCYPGRTPGECVAHVQMVVNPSMAGDAFQARWDRNWKLLIDTVVQEDWAISSEVQRALTFLPGDRALFGRNEPGLQHFHGVLDRAIQDFEASQPTEK